MPWLLVAFGIVVISAGSSRPAPKRHKKDERLDQARKIYARVCNVMGVRQPPPLKFDFTVANAEADGISILVNPAWLRDVLDMHCADFACHVVFLAGVLAHELGHHVFGHPGSFRYREASHRCEFEADAFAAKTLARLGIPHDDFAGIIARLSEHGSDTHPPGWERAHVIGRIFEQERVRLIVRKLQLVG